MIRKQLLVASIIVCAVVIVGIFTGLYYFSPATILGPCYSMTVGAWSRFTIIANETTGYNNSAYQPFMMNVPKGNCVLIKFVNTARTEPHGLFIEHYYSSGSVAQPGQSVSITFQANLVGQFKVGEQIVSSINGFTDDAGTLTVT